MSRAAAGSAGAPGKPGSVLKAGLSQMAREVGGRGEDGILGWGWGSGSKGPWGRVVLISHIRGSCSGWGQTSSAVEGKGA